MGLMKKRNITKPYEYICMHAQTKFVTNMYAYRYKENNRNRVECTSSTVNRIEVPSVHV